MELSSGRLTSPSRKQRRPLCFRCPRKRSANSASRAVDHPALKTPTAAWSYSGVDYRSLLQMAHSLVRSVYPAGQYHRIWTSPAQQCSACARSKYCNQHHGDRFSNTILITGSCSGFSKAAAIGMARNGHNIIATAHVSSQVTPLREEAAALELKNLRVERLDLDDPYDVKQAIGWDFDVLWNN